MASNLGVMPATGKLSANNLYVPGAWLIEYTPQMMPAAGDFEIYHGSIRGPGGTFLVFIDGSQYGIGRNGLINEYSPTIPMYVRKGQTVSLHWSISTGNAPQCWFWFREPEVGRI